MLTSTTTMGTGLATDGTVGVAAKSEPEAPKPVRRDEPVSKPLELSGHCHATCVQAMLMFIWVGGFLFIPTVAVLLLLGYYTAAVLGASLAVWCYIGPLPSEVCKNQFMYWVNSAIPHMFRNTSLTIEESWREGAFNGQAPVMLAYHPHGIFCWGFFMYGGMHPDISPLRGLIAAALCAQPFFCAMFLRFVGVVGSAGKSNFINQLRRRESVALLPGGFHEASLMEQGVDAVYLKKRSGFVYYALQHGYRLVPVYTFGESDTYWTLAGGLNLRFMLNDWNIPTILPVGKWWCPLFPKYDCEVHTVQGKAITLPKIEKPTKEDVSKWHKIYMDELEALFDRNKVWASSKGADAKLHFY